ncbi:MAG: hypothetical protein AAFX03_07070 [Pseudomonadota bacterium]
MIWSVFALAVLAAMLGGATAFYPERLEKDRETNANKTLVGAASFYWVLATSQVWQKANSGELSLTSGESLIWIAVFFFVPPLAGLIAFAFSASVLTRYFRP